MMEIREFFAREWTGAEKTLVILSCILLGVVNGFLISPVKRGISCGNNLSSLFPLIKEAEQKMYAEKRNYYEKHDRRRTPRT